MRRSLAPRSCLLVCPIVMLLLGVMVSCGGSPSQPGGGTPVKITAAKAPTSTSVEVTFSRAVGEGADDPGNYHLKAPGGASLHVMAAYPDAAGTTVTLATQPQDLVDYGLTATHLKAKDGQPVPDVAAPAAFAGSNVVAPIVASAVSLSNTSVLVTFADPATAKAVAMEQGADDARFYRINAPDLKVEKATPQPDGTSVVLTTAPQARESYTVQVTNVYSKVAKLLIDPFTNSATFAGIPPDDKDPPTVTRVTATNDATVLISFSEPVQDGAADRTHYAITDPSKLPLTVLEATLDSFKTTATLKTAAQTQGTTYTLEISDLRDVAGNEMAKGTSQTFVGASATGSGSDTTAPRVLGATSLNNKSLVITFSEPLDKASAETAANYSIFGASKAQDLEPQAILLVSTANLNEGGRSVTLTTLSQSDIQYNVQVANVKDLAGNFISPPDRDNPYVATFRGTAPSGSDATDTDGDGLNDDVEQRGWTVTVKLANGTQTSREVTSDPTDPDTDDDGLTDDVEKAQSLDPRSKDTDTDELSDDAEYNVYYSEPLIQDTDGDGLVDGLEVNLFKTSPIDEDTDADGLLDGDEVGINNANPRAILADLPRFDTVISSVDLQLDYRFNETVGSNTTNGKTQSTAVTTLRADQATSSRQNSSTQNWFAKAGTEFCFGGSCDSENGGIGNLSFNFGFKFNAEAGGGGETSFVSTEENARTVQDEYAKTLETNEVVSAEKTVSREVVGATMKVSVTFKSQSNVSFVLKNLEFTAQILDPADPTRYLPIGRMVSPGLEVDLGPKGSPQQSKGPIIFEIENPVPSVVEKLMQDPRGILVSLGNYRVEVRGERNFVFSLEDIANRTAQFEIDYGGRRGVERLNPATYAGFDDMGKPKGITLKQFMEQFLELKHVVARPSSDGRSCTESTPASELQASYSTCMISVAGGQTEALWRVRDVSRSANLTATSWWVLTPENGLITPVPEAEEPWNGLDFSTYRIRSGKTYAIKFVVDEDFDGLEATVEASMGTDDNNADSDGDGIGDGDEVYGLRDVNGKRSGWPIQLSDGTLIKTNPNPARADSDRDGLTDCQELVYEGCSSITVSNGASGPNLVNDGTVVATFPLPNPTDPSNPDTDREGLADGLEVAGYKGKKYDDALNLVDFTLLPKNGKPAINPLDPTTDADALTDFMEVRLGTDPTVDDGDKVLDDDGDGLVNFAEAVGWRVTSYGVSGSPGVQGAARYNQIVKSDPKKADADGDGLNDQQEKAKGTHPDDGDTDGDGLLDNVDPYPLDADQDNDLLSDKEEQAGCLGFGPTGLNNADTDGDSLVDGAECKTYRTNPNNRNTDSDGYEDGREVAIGLNPLVMDEILRVNISSYDTIGDCELDTIFEDALSGRAEFEGILKLRQPNGSVQDLWNMAISGAQYGDTHAGQSFNLIPTGAYTPNRQFALAQGGASASLFSTSITEVDARTCCDTSVLGELGNPTKIEFAYPQGTQNFSQRVGPNTGCMVQFNYRSEVIP